MYPNGTNFVHYLISQALNQTKRCLAGTVVDELGKD